MKEKTLVVKGQGYVSTPPDIIILAISLESVREKYHDAMKRGSEKLELLKSAVISAGHNGKDLKTCSFNINTKYESYRDNGGHKEKFVGYVCNHSLSLQFDLNMDVLANTLGAIAKCGARPRFNIQFSVKDTNAVSVQLLESAVSNAKQKAEVLTKTSGVRLGEIKSIDYSWSDVHYYSNTNYLMDAYSVNSYTMSSKLTMDIEPEDIETRDSVTVIWSIE